MYGQRCFNSTIDQSMILHLLEQWKGNLNSFRRRVTGREPRYGSRDTYERDTHGWLLRIDRPI